MRATWRTALEWARLLLALDPHWDPYCVRLVIDQYALRARQPQVLIDLAESKYFKTAWGDLPNIQITLGLAYIGVQSPQKGREILATVVKRFPWIISRLFKELGIDQIPPSIWGKMPRTELETLFTELYVTRAKDIWNTSEATSLLVEVASAVRETSEAPQHGESAISHDIARHVAMTELPALIGLIPRDLLSTITSVSDPLPPEDNLISYQVSS